MENNALYCTCGKLDTDCQRELDAELERQIQAVLNSTEPTDEYIGTEVAQ